LMQTFLVFFLLAQSPEECKLMVSGNTDFAELAGLLETNYRLWQSGGAAPACRDLCCSFTGKDYRVCVWPCQLVLPWMWRLYGPLWVSACITHRIIFGVRPLPLAC
jgi:hypothetical protein